MDSARKEIEYLMEQPRYTKSDMLTTHRRVLYGREVIWGRVADLGGTSAKKYSYVGAIKGSAFDTAQEARIAAISNLKRSLRGQQMTIL